MSGRWTDRHEPPASIGPLLILAYLVVALAIGGTIAGPDYKPDRPPTVCTEDMPCWDCETMGNRICGVKP